MGRRARLAAALPLALAVLAAPACAGAWLKEKGETYLSFGVDQDRWGSWLSLYGEHGWRDGYTIGVSLGGRENPLMPVTGMDVEGYAFLRGAIRGEGDTRIAWQVGAGAKLDAAHGTIPQAHLGGAIGRGFPNGRWANLDLAAVTTFHPERETHELRADAAVGLGEMRLGSVVIEGSARYDGDTVDYGLTPTLGREFRGFEVRGGVRLGTENGLRLRVSRSF